MLADLLVARSRATNVNDACRKGSVVHVAVALMPISIDERPTQVTRPSSAMSSSRLGRWRYTMRSTLAVTSSRSSSPGWRQCSKAIVPAKASRSSSSRPTRTWPHGLRYVSASSRSVLNGYVNELAESIGAFSTRVRSPGLSSTTTSCCCLISIRLRQSESTIGVWWRPALAEPW